MIYDFLIIGGGASGVSALVSYRKYHPKKSVLLLESNNELLKKVNASGNGKGNFTNTNITHYNYNNGEYFKAQIDESYNRVLKFFNDLSVLERVDTEGRVYPYSLSAKSLSLSMIDKLNPTDYMLNTKIDKIEYKDNIFIVKSKDLEFKSYKLLIATGSKNYKALGSDGALFGEIEKLGHTFTKIYPSNIYILVKEKDITKRLSGLRFKATLTLFNNKNTLYQEYGELLFKDNALSGIVSFNISNRLANLYKNSKDINPYITIDFMSEYTHKELKELISKYDSIDHFIDYTFNIELSKIFKEKYKSIDDLVKLIKSFKFNIESLGDFDHAQVSSGGINLSQVTTNFESKIIKGLFFSGDILDVDAPCGGYNLTFAFNSGILIGTKYA